MRISHLSILLLLLAIVTSCMNDDFKRYDLPKTVNKRVLFIINEGNFMYGNASLSVYDIEKKTVERNVFSRVNKDLPLGDVAQSMTIRNGLGYIVINNSGRVYVIDPYSYTYESKIINLTSPRYIHFINDEKAYVTDLYAKAISIVNPKTNTVKKKIRLSRESLFYQHPTERMVQYKQFVFVNCWSYDNTILVIDSNTDKLVDSLEVPKQPNSMAMDKNNKIWVLTDGGFPGSKYGQEKPALVKIDAEHREIELIIKFDMDESPSELCLNGTKDTLYFINRHIWQMSIDKAQKPKTPFVKSPYGKKHSGGFYGLGVDPKTSEVYISDAIDYVQSGIVYRYSPKAVAIDSFKVGIIPGAFCFRETFTKK